MKRTVWLTLLLTAASTAHVQADVIVEFQDTSLNSGTIGNDSLGSINVFARTDAGDVEFGQFSLQFEISNALPGTGILQFQSTVDQKPTERGEANYVLGAQAGVGLFQSNRQVNLRRLIQQDQLASAIIPGLAGSTVTLGTTAKLIGTLEIQHQSAAAVAGAFEISLIEDANTTFFQFYNGFTPTKVAINSQSYSNSGAIIVAVPEPSALAGVLFATACPLLMRRRRQ